MIRRLERRAVVALLAGVAMVAVLAAPASAGTGVGTIDDGTAVIDMTGNGGPEAIWEVGDDPADPPNCNPVGGDVTIEVEFDATGASDATTEVTDLTAPTNPFENTGTSGADFYMLGVALGPGDNTGVIGSGNVTQNLSLAATVSEVAVDGQGTCVPGDVVCNVLVFLDGTLGSGSLVGTWTGDATGTDPAGTFDLDTAPSDDGVAFRSSPCSPPFFGWLGSSGVPVTVADLVVTVS